MATLVLLAVVRLVLRRLLHRENGGNAAANVMVYLHGDTVFSDHEMFMRCLAGDTKSETRAVGELIGNGGRVVWYRSDRNLSRLWHAGKRSLRAVRCRHCPTWLPC